MPFNESNAERKIGGKEAPKDIEAIKKELKEKYPETLRSIERKVENLRKHTERVKKYDPELDDFKNYVKGAEFEEALLSPFFLDEQRKSIIGVEPLFNLIIIKESCLPIIKKLKDFAPDSLDKMLKDTLMHEKEHLKGTALKIYLKEIKARTKGDLALAEKLRGEAEFYAESQRILKHSKSAADAVEAIALKEVFWLLLFSGIERGLGLDKGGLVIEVDKEASFKSLSEMPDKESKSIKGLYPYLKEDEKNKKDIIGDVINRIEEIRKDLREKYEEKYGKIEEGEVR